MQRGSWVAKVFVEAKLTVLSILGESFVQGLHGEWLGAGGWFCSYHKHSITHHAQCWENAFPRTTCAPSATLRTTAIHDVRALQQCSTDHNDPATRIYVTERRKRLLTFNLDEQCRSKSNAATSNALWVASITVMQLPHLYMHRNRVVTISVVDFRGDTRINEPLHHRLIFSLGTTVK